MSEAQWKQFVQLFAEKNQHLTKQQVLQQAKKPFLQLKKYFSQRGGLSVDENIRYLLGVDNPHRNNMPDMLACSEEPADPAVLTKFNTNRTFVEVNGLSDRDENERELVHLLAESHRQGYRMSNAHLLNIFQHKFVWGLCKRFYSQNGEQIDDAACRILAALIIANSQYLRRIGVIYQRFKIIEEYQNDGNNLFPEESVSTLTDHLQDVFLLFINIILSYKPEHRVIFSDATILTDLHNLRSCYMVRQIFSYYRNRKTAFGWGIVSMGNSIQTIITNGAAYIDLLYNHAITKLYSFGENLLRRGTSKSEEAFLYDPQESEYFIKKDYPHDRIADPRKQLLRHEPPKKLISDKLKGGILAYLRTQNDSTPRTDAELIEYLKDLKTKYPTYQVDQVKRAIMSNIGYSYHHTVQPELDKLLE